MIWNIEPFISSSTSSYEGVSEMASLCGTSGHDETSGLVLIGGNGGSIVLLDVNKCTRKAFSTTLTPTVVRTWNMLRIMQKQRGISGALPSKKWLGVKKFCVWQDAWHTTFDDVNDGEGDGKLVNKKKQRNAGVVDVTVT
eukprot:8265577-Ditylum_brightwellii.AAC.1